MIQELNFNLWCTFTIVRPARATRAPMAAASRASIPATGASVVATDAAAGFYHGLQCIYPRPLPRPTGLLSWPSVHLSTAAAAADRASIMAISAFIHGRCLGRQGFYHGHRGVHHGHCCGKRALITATACAACQGFIMTIRATKTDTHIGQESFYHY
jgi:hypothetical protein